MCGPTNAKVRKRVSFANDNPVKTSEERSSIYQKVYPIHPSVALCVMAVVFAYFPALYTNRGFTVWWHYASVFYFLTQSKFVKKFLILSGISISLGWYACLLYEIVVHGRCFVALYKNMPILLIKHMLLDNEDATTSATNDALNATAVRNGTLDFLSTHSLLAMFASHVLDILFHPVLTYYFWSKYNSTKDSETNIKQNKEDNETIFTWPVILTAYCYSRIWSLFHTYHNFGFFAWFYVGFDVYVIDDLDLWYPPYVMETLVYSSLIIWKVTTKRSSSKLKA